jgi:Uma2 family endonuclease
MLQARRGFPYTSTIQEIVLVNQYYSSVEVWQRDAEHPENPNAWYYRHYGPGEVVELTSLNIQLAMGEIYEEMNFDIEEEDEDEGFDAEDD